MNSEEQKANCKYQAKVHKQNIIFFLFIRLNIRYILINQNWPPSTGVDINAGAIQGLTED